MVALLARYPVKSLCGEVLDEVEVGPRGLAGDRGWAVYSEDGGILKTLGADGDPEFGLQAHVVEGGRLRRGDAAVLL